MPLFTEADLRGLLGKADPARTVLAERVVWGWLKPILGLSERPDPVPEELFSWAVELGAIAYTNPSGLSSQQSGPYSEQFSAERREKILEEIRNSALNPGGAGLRPTGRFPPATCYPDPA